jgi:hypothetical protein
MQALSRWLALQRAATVLTLCAHVLATTKIARLNRMNAQSQIRQKVFSLGKNHRPEPGSFNPNFPLARARRVMGGEFDR